MLPLVKVGLPKSELLMPSLERVLYSGQIAEGEQVYEFEEKFGKHFGLPNILAGRSVVPEILQDQAPPENLAEALVKLYEDKENAALVAEAFTEIHLQLRHNTAEKAANAVIECLN